MRTLHFRLLILLSAVLYAGICYFTSRVEFSLLFGQYSLLFLILGAMFFRRESLLTNVSFKEVQWFSFFLRCLLIFSIPNLSDDYFRFLWDGNIWLQGENPYAILPAEFEVKADSNLPALLQGMNSPGYFSVYPPLNQFLFGSAAFLFPGSFYAQIICLKIFILISEGLLIWMLPKLIELFNRPKELSLLYLLNPLAIIEGVGNMHFESMTLSFLCCALYFMLKGRHFFFSLFLALSTGIKILPLIMFPVFLRVLGWKQGFLYVFIATLIFLSFFFPFLEVDTWSHMYTSLELYFQKFEFNASIYYVIRYLGMEMSGYNMIREIGRFLFVLNLVVVAVMFFRTKFHNYSNMMDHLFLLILVYYALATTVHPWYVLNLLFLSLFTPYYRAVAVWTFTVFLSYSAYMSEQYTEQAWLIALEYIVFGVFLILDHRKQEHKKKIAWKD